MTADGIDIDADLALARDVADAADAFTLPHFIDRDFTVDWKQNATEVTEIDRRAELIITERLRDARPQHRVFGEEHGARGPSEATLEWVIDPIDGTSGFVRGVPIWATLIALVDDETGPVLGVVSAPALGFRWWGAPGRGAIVSARGRTRAIHVSAVDDLASAQVSITHSSGWDTLGKTSALNDLQRRARRSRGLGDFWQHMLVAEGAIDVAVDAVGVAPYDLAAVQPIVEAAGGRFTDRHGDSTHRNDTAISTNGLLHDEVLAAIR